MTEQRSINTGGGRYSENKGTYIENLTIINQGNQEYSSSNNQTLTLNRQKLISQESQSLNLIELKFPESLYVADLVIDRESIIRNSQSQESKKRLTNKSSYKDLIRAYFEQNGLKFGVDWICYNGKIITFHNLTNENIPLTRIINKASINLIKTELFFQQNPNHESVFKSLLDKCLQQKIFHQKVIWQHQEKLFIFASNETSKRQEKWHGKKESTRTVYECIMKKKNPEEVSYHKHLAFRTQYKHFGEHWYLVIKPEWFFSFDGYKKSFYHQEQNNWIKKQEHNQQVFNHLRFIYNFITLKPEANLFQKQYNYEFLNFGLLVAFSNAPNLDDKNWQFKESLNNLPLLEYYDET